MENLIYKNKKCIIFSFTILSFSFNAPASLVSLDTNLLTNPGFEAGLTGWQSSDATIRQSSDPSPYAGSNYIFGRATPSFYISQTVDLLSMSFTADDIDNNALNINFGGWQSGWNSFDEGQITISLLDTNMVELTIISLSSFTSTRANAGGIGWQQQAGITDLLSGTRHINFEFVGTRGPDFPDEPEFPPQNKNNDAYLDNAYLEITSVPVPASLWLFGSGIIGLIGFARQKNSVNR